MAAATIYKESSKCASYLSIDLCPKKTTPKRLLSVYMCNNENEGNWCMTDKSYTNQSLRFGPVKYENINAIIF